MTKVEEALEKIEFTPLAIFTKETYVKYVFKCNRLVRSGKAKCFSMLYLVL